MKDLNKPKFEEEWRRAFEEAELPPDSDVWARLDAHLANQETRKYKNRLVWFQRIAAGVLLLLLAGGTWLWQHENVPSPGLANRPGEAGAGQQAIARSNGASPDASAGDASVSSGAAIARAEKEETFAGREAKRGHQPAPASSDLAQARTSATAARVDGTGEAGLSDESTPPRMLSHSAKNGKAGAGRIANGGNRGRQGSSPVQEPPIGPPGAGPAGEAIAVVRPPDAAAKEAISVDPAAGRMAFNELSSRTLHAKEPVIRPQSILPHLSEAYWAKVLATEEKAQEEKGKRDRWQVGLAFAPGTYQPNFRVNESSSAFANTVGSIAPSFNNARTNVNALSAANNDLETASAAGLSYQTGVRMEYAITRRFSVQSGVDYLYNSSSVNTYSYVQDFFNGRNEPVFASILNYGNQTRAESTMADAVGPPSPGNAFAVVNTKNLSQSASAISVRNVYEYVGIPVKVNYLLLDKKLGATLGAGVSGDIFLNNRFGNEDEGIDEVNLASAEGTAYRKLGISAWLGLKMQYRFGSRYSVFVEPSYRAAVTSFTNTQALQSHPSLFAVGTGLQMRF